MATNFPIAARVRPLNSVERKRGTQVLVNVDRSRNEVILSDGKLLG